MKILNPTKSPLTLRRNAKVADVFPCVAVEDLPISQGVSETQLDQTAGTTSESGSTSDPFQRLKECGLGDIDLEGCEVSEEWRQRLAKLVLSYQDVFPGISWTVGKQRGLFIVYTSLMTAPSGCPIDEFPQHITTN